MKIHRKRYKENILKYTKSIFHGEYKELDHKDSLVINRYIHIYIHTYIHIYIYIYIYIHILLENLPVGNSAKLCGRLLNIFSAHMSCNNCVVVHRIS